MSANEKIYRAYPSGPPTYQQANSEDSRQITQNPDWNYSLFECCSPCSLCINADCVIFGALSLGYFQWIIQTIRRGEMRERLGIKGSCCGDCCATFWCGCCALVQEEKEVELRTRPELIGYQPPPQMAYP